MAGKKAKIVLVASAAFAVLAALLLICFAFAAPVLTPSTTPAFSINEDDANSLINITINNTDAGGAAANISQVNITLPPAGFAIVSGTNNTSAAGSLIVNTSNVISYTNSTVFLINGGGQPGSLQSFWFNVSVANPLAYNITVTTVSAAAPGTPISQNMTVQVNDTTAPDSINFTVPAVNNTNVSSTSYTINVSVSDNANVSSCLLNFNGTNSTSFMTKVGDGTSVVCTQTVTGLANASTYNFTAYANDTAGKMNQSPVWWLMVDTQFPSFIINTSGSTAEGNYSQTYISANVTGDDVNRGIFNTSLWYWNGTLYATKLNATLPALNNFTGLPDGQYYINASLNDSAGNVNFSILNVTLDNAAPVVSLSDSDVEEEYLTLSVGISDTSGSFSTCTANISHYTTTIISPTSQKINITSLSCDHEYAINVTCTDAVGLSNSAHNSFGTSSCEDDGASGGGGGGGTTTGSTTYLVTAAQLAAGFTQALASKEKLKFSISNIDHTLTIDNILMGSVAIIVESTPQNAMLGIGAMKKFDVNADEFYDISVRLNSVANSKANITVKSVHEAVPASTTTVTNATRTSEGEAGATGNQTALGAVLESVSGTSIWVWIGVAAAILVAVVIFLKFRK